MIFASEIPMRSKRPTVKIITSNVCPPIPSRKCDWIAYRADWDLGMPVGEGETEEAAKADLLERELDDIDEARALEARDDAKRERDSYTTANCIEWD
jgi:hypothetical protein